MIPSRKSKAIGLFSGGLDSILATKLVTEQGVTVVALRFRMPFAAPGRILSDDRLSQLAQLVGASLVSVDAGEDYLGLIRSPEFGYSRQAAPCLDCMVYMQRKARELAKELRADFVFTGDVVGQRSFCQNKRSLRVVEKAAALEGRLLRPLSAKLLEPTIPELTGLVRRERLLDFRGRGRRRQIRLAHEFGIIDYPIPGGGCLLCDKNFAARCRDGIAHDQFSPGDIELMRYGRHFRLESGAKVVVGRNQSENEVLERLVAADDTVCRPVDVMGPVALLRSKKKTKKDTELVARICARYSDGGDNQAVRVACGDRQLSVKPAKDADLEPLRIRAAESERVPDAEASEPETKDE
jgi:tRNA-specific 2-thiouridylase